MRENYQDILDLAENEDPKWWDLDGVPRFREPTKEEKKVIRRIKCQECQRIFVVKLTCHYEYYLGNLMYKNPTWKIPKGWFYGDPPFHCDDGNGNVCHAGYTMGSISEYEWKEFFKEKI